MVGWLLNYGGDSAEFPWVEGTLGKPFGCIFRIGWDVQRDADAWIERIAHSVLISI